MKHSKILALAGTAAVGLCAHSAALASEDEAVRLCEQQITNAYKVDKFHNVWAEQTGHHKYKVHGNVKYNHDKHPFDCVVKRGQIRSYYYDGPHPGLADNNEDVDVGTALAVGAGLAIVAAIAGSLADDGGSAPATEKTYLEDECHEALERRMRDDHHESAEAKLKTSELGHGSLSGEGKVKWSHSRPNHFTYTCEFDNRNLVSDSSYVLY